MLLAFDCDGVLVDSEIIASEVDAEILTRLGYPVTPEDVTRRFTGLTAKSIFELVEADLGHPVPQGVIDEQKLELDRRLKRDLKAVPGAADLLDRIEGQRCVCSNSTSERLAMSLHKTGLYDRFAPHIFSAVEVGTKEPKPAPNVYLHAAAAFGIHAGEMVVIEDSVFGVTAAKAAGARVVGFAGGRHSWLGHADLLTDAGAGTVIRRLADLPRIADALMAWEGMTE
jgi:HAD superfamily hydrolase (TIGR01509 family)